jgi:hypothetical protein
MMAHEWKDDDEEEADAVRCQNADPTLHRFGRRGHPTLLLGFGVRLRTCVQGIVGWPDATVELRVPSGATRIVASKTRLVLRLSVHGCRVFASGFDGLGNVPLTAGPDQEAAWTVERRRLFAELFDQNRFGTLRNGGAVNYAALLLELTGKETAPSHGPRQYTVWLTTNVGADRGADAMTQRLIAGTNEFASAWDWEKAELCVESSQAVTVSALEASAPLGGVDRRLLAARREAAGAD